MFLLCPRCIGGKIIRLWGEGKCVNCGYIRQGNPSQEKSFDGRHDGVSPQRAHYRKEKHEFSGENTAHGGPRNR